MADFLVSIDGHSIQMDPSFWSSLETVTCDGVLVSGKRSWQFTTSHGFEVVEKSGERTSFEVEFHGGFAYGFAGRRYGLLVAASPENEITPPSGEPDSS